ncbi:hypothetical protein SKAU_G00386490 [Synaphobranchus kaupii]|uniref:CxC3 like cysteine cluster domain-containing protein n=1 Tax=Synaphobranchus kaupii TaxID=118154 RepID=A0A9Q1EEP5_SYNKA|nr:hypothetical protein SKAU_G00386490 [Synaphobranchus kaupii]
MPTHTCQHCSSQEGVIRCRECLPRQYLCTDCDLSVHKLYVLHNRESVFDGFFNAIPPTSAVVRDEHGQHQLCEQACLLPTNLPESICVCNHPNLSLTAGKPVTLVTINGRYDLCLPSLCCQSCQKSWTPEVVDLLACNYWPATVSCQTIYMLDVFASFADMKVMAPALSRQAFIKLLEQRSIRCGRGGSICGDSFQKSYLKYRYCQFEVDKLCRVAHFVCPACIPDMLAVSADGNRKHYRFKKSKGTDEKAFFEGLFLVKDEEVSSFVDKIRSQMKSRPGSAVCGTSTWTAARESSQKSSAKVDEEGLEITVCRHCLLLKGLNMYRGEIYAYPMFLQQEMARTRNVSFFCTDIACRYWPYLERMVEKVPELQDLTKMKPFLSVMHAKAHTWKCEVKWGGRNQVGAGTTIGEEVEQTNSFLSRTVEMEKTEAASLEALREELHCTSVMVQQWVSDVQQSALRERGEVADSQEELQKTIEELSASLQRQKHDLYRQSDSCTKRQRTRRKITDLKRRLREAILQYNSSVADAGRIDVDAACDLSHTFVLPWEVQGDETVITLGNKRLVFDKVMLVSRLEEEQAILVKEMSQHYSYLQKLEGTLKDLLNQTRQDILRQILPSGLTEAGSHGLCSVLQRRLHQLQKKQAEVKNTYSNIITMDLTQMAEVEEEEDEDGYSSPDFSEEEDD